MKSTQISLDAPPLRPWRSFFWPVRSCGHSQGERAKTQRIRRICEDVQKARQDNAQYRIPTRSRCFISRPTTLPISP